MKSVGAYEAKTHLPRLLREVEKGEEILITRQGVPVAILTQPGDRSARVKKAIQELREFRKGKSLGGLKIKDLIEEGRRY
jgi:prevent-host-death family protein